MMLELARATGDESLRRQAIQTANYVTYYLQPDDRIVVGLTDLPPGMEPISITRVDLLTLPPTWYHPGC